MPREIFLIMLLVLKDAYQLELEKPFCAEVDGNSATKPGIYEYDFGDFRWVRRIFFFPEA